MKAAEILRKLADMIDTHSDDQVQAATTVELTPVDVDSTDNTELSTMVPPLQAKLELLKKAVDVDSHYDQDDELELMKQRAGISPAVIVASEDNDVVG